jgi:hypothetical protein
MIKPELSNKAAAVIEAANAEAVAELLNALSEYWECVLDVTALKQHDPHELIPLFERYAERQYNAYAEELLPHFSDVAMYAWHLSVDVIDQISYEIRPENGFIPDNPTSGEWTYLLHLLKNSEPDVKEELGRHFPAPNGDWEIYLERSFQRRQLKGPDISARSAKEAWLLFALKYQFHLRLFINWQSFDMRLRSHLSNRLAFWEAKAHRRLAEQTGEPGTPGLDMTADKDSSPSSRGQARQAIVMPILKSKRWTRGKWATKAAVGKNSVYEYLDGRRTLSASNRNAMAEALGLKPTGLPE